MRRGVDFLAVGLDHVVFAQRILVVDGLDGHSARTVFGWFGVYGDGGGFVGRVDEQLVGRLRRAQRPPVDGEQVVAFLHVDARLSKGRTRVWIPVLPRIDLLESIQPAGRIVLIVHSQQAHADGMNIRLISTADVSVGVGKLPDHFTQDVREVVAIGRIRHERLIFLANRVPVHAIHAGFKEIVALLPPDFVEDLVPFGRRVNLCAHATEIQRALACFFGRVRFGIDDAISAVFGLIENLRAVERDRPALAALDDGLLFALLHIERVNGSLFAGKRPGQPLYRLRRVVEEALRSIDFGDAGHRHGQRHDAVLNPVEIDAKVLGDFCGFLLARLFFLLLFSFLLLVLLAFVLLGLRCRRRRLFALDRCLVTQRRKGRRRVGAQRHQIRSGRLWIRELEVIIPQHLVVVAV